MVQCMKSNGNNMTNFLKIKLTTYIKFPEKNKTQLKR